MLTGDHRGNPGVHASASACPPENMLLSGYRMTAAAFARRQTTNDRGPSKGPLSAASPILCGAASGRILEHTSIQEHVK